MHRPGEFFEHRVLGLKALALQVRKLAVTADHNNGYVTL